MFRLSILVFSLNIIFQQATYAVDPPNKERAEIDPKIETALTRQQLQQMENLQRSTEFHVLQENSANELSKIITDIERTKEYAQERAEAAQEKRRAEPKPPKIGAEVYEAVQDGKTVEIILEVATTLADTAPLKLAGKANRKRYIERKANIIETARKRYEEAGAIYVSEIESLNALVLRAGEKVIQFAERDDNVKRVSLNVEDSLFLASSVPPMNLDTLHGQGFTGTGKTVAILDTAIRRTH